jgi:DNA-binding protein HU-beta
MTKAELIEKIARSRELPPDVTKKCVGQILDLAFEELGTYFVRAKVTRSQCPRFTFPGFGTFTKKKRSARKGVNPRTLEPMTIEASYTIDFRPGTDLRQHLNARVAVASVKGKRRAGTAQLDLDPAELVEPAMLSKAPKLQSVAPAAIDEEEDDSVPIHRRRFTNRDDLDDDLEETDELDEVDEEDEAFGNVEAAKPADAAYQLAPAPMQRARLRGAASTPRTGS